MGSILKFVQCFLVIFNFWPYFIYADKYERDLYKKLLSNYNIHERPVLNHTDTVFVKLQLVLSQLVDLDEKNQTIQLNLWLKYDWIDYNLRWDPVEHGGIEDLRIPTGSIWRPDVLLYNSVSDTYDTTYQVNYVVYHSGLVTWVPPAIVKSSCTLHVTWFPFDQQICHFKFGSWTHSAAKLDLDQAVDGGWDMSEYIRNGEWDILDYKVIRTDKAYDCCRGNYVDLKFSLHVRRRTLYYGFNKIIPSMLIALIAILAFALPSESVEKIALETTIFLAMCLFLDMLVTVTPPSDSLPFLGIFFSSIMILVTTSVVFNIMTLNMHYRTAYKYVMSPMVRKIFLKWLPLVLCMKPWQRKLKRRKAYYTARKRKSAGVMENGQAENISGNKKKRVNKFNCAGHRKSCISENPIGKGLLSFELARVHREVKLIARDMRRTDDIYIRAEKEWRYAGKVIDRICLLILFSLLLAASCVITLAANGIMGKGKH